jgi:hypothetical protein
MKKKIPGILILVLTINSCVAQNLVPNPSFENYISCPTALNQIYTCQDWHSFGYVPDYLNVCASNPQVSVPNNYYGYQVPASGNAYAVFLNVHVPSPTRDFIGAQLLQPLVIGQTYYVSLKISLVGFSCPTNKMGVLFSTLPFDSIHPPPLNNFAHIYTDTIVTDTMNWFNITGSFIADSNYSYITIGNFFLNPTTNTFCGNIWSDWYYVDDVCVSTDSMTCYYPVGMEEVSNGSIELFPNPATGELRINPEHSGAGLKIKKIEIYNAFGERVFSQPETSNSKQAAIDVSYLASGIYFVTVTDKERKSVTKRFVKM